MQVKKEKNVPAPKPTVAFSDFAKLDLRIGKVVTAERLVGSEKLIRIEVDFGKDLDIRTILAGIAAWYKPEDLLGRKFIFVYNLLAREMMGTKSEGMMMAVDDGEKAILLPVDDAVSEGWIVR